jgi:hypothetical protein
MSGIFDQRYILNFAPRDKFWRQGRSCPPGVNFVPWGERKDEHSPWGQISPLGAKLHP